MSLIILAVAIAIPPLEDLELPAAGGGTLRHSIHAAGRPAVVAFLGVDCPLASLYAGRLNELSRRCDSVSFVAIDSNADDDLPAMKEFAHRRGLTYPFLKDADGRIAEMFEVMITPTVVVLDADRKVRYRGRIDNQYSRGGADRGKPTREDLYEALRELLAGKPVSVAETEPTGCVLDRPRTKPTPSVAVLSYSKDIAPIIASNCRFCHRPGEVAPFPLLTFADAKAHAGTIAEVVTDGTMPPWHAAPEHGRFRNERRLTDHQKRAILDWVHSGCLENAPSAPVDISPAPKWRFGDPDTVFRLPHEFSVPAQGVIPYQHFIVDTGYKSDVWVSAFEVRPTNRRVVHHCSVFLQPPNADGTETYFETGSLGSFFLASFTPGTGAVQFPPGMAKRIPAGSRLHFAVHYQPIGTPEVERLELGLRLADPRTVRKEVATKVLLADDIAIPPHEPNHHIERAWTAPADVLLLSLFPHMHVRGKSVRYKAEYPDGTSEILLDVPRYDFNWQHWYELVAPIRLPAGTVIRATAIYDNSAANANNPDPSATVHTGFQSWDEMFNMYFDVALAEEDLVATAESDALRRRWLALISLAALSALLRGAFVRRRTLAAASVRT